jgi:hypothetical protein
MIQFYIILSTIGAFVVFLYFCGKGIFLHKKRETMVKNFESYVAVLQYHMEKAYDMVHRDQILVYSLEATTLPDKEFHKASIDFLQLVQKLLGPNLNKEMIFLYGDYDTFIFNLAEYFNRRYDDDEIRKTSMGEMMESEVEPEGA